MKEDFLHYVWKFQKLTCSEFRTVENERLFVRKQGSHNLNAGPDFFNAQIELDGQLWAGNIEIHIRSSDWYAHNHEADPAYDNVILHVVWEHDGNVYRKDNSSIPTLVLNGLVPKNTVDQYQKLFSKDKKWINCEQDFAHIDPFVIENWLERLYIERLGEKEEILFTELKETQNHWEFLLFRMLCKSFGLNINGESFFNIARSFDFSVVKKCSQSQFQLEALFFGQAGMLEKELEDVYFQRLKAEYGFLKHKFSLLNEGIIPPSFFRLRPPNFPTIRLSQLAALYSINYKLFSKVIVAENLFELYKIFDVSASNYWDAHFNFGVVSKEHKKRLSKTFMDLLIINTVLPIKFSYAMHQGKDASDMIIQMISAIPSEKNAVVDKFNSIREISKNALHSQALIQLKKEYCDKNRCLYCTVGNSILSKK